MTTNRFLNTTLNIGNILINLISIVLFPLFVVVGAILESFGFMPIKDLTKNCENSIIHEDKWIYV